MVEKKTASLTNSAGKSGYTSARKTKTKSMSITLQECQLKINQGPSYQTQNSEVSTGRSTKCSGTNRYSQRLPQENHSNPATKRKNGKMGLHKI
jgi:hypothetical protein